MYPPYVKNPINNIPRTHMHTQTGSGCGNAEVGFDSLELGVGMGEDMQIDVVLNWVRVFRGGVRQP